MKNFFFIFVFSILYNFVHATDSLRAYYSMVAKAEWAVCEGNFSQVASLYRIAFLYNANPFYTDILRALNAELELADLDTIIIEQYFRQILLTRGWHAVERTHTDNFLNRFRIGRLGNNIEKLISQYFSADTSDLQLKIMLMHSEDQRVRRESMGFLDTCYSGTLYDRRIVYTDSINNLKLLELLRTNPEILDENVVGFSTVQQIETLLMHQTYTSFDAREYLLQAVRDGIFDARTYARLSDRYHLFVSRDNDTLAGVFSGDYFGTHNLWNFEVPNEKSLSLIFTDERNRTIKNNRRAEIFLGDILDASFREFCMRNRGGTQRTFLLSMDELNSMLNHFRDINIQFDYYIANEKDFDFNFKRTE